MSSAWIYQKPAEVKTKGESKASWYVGWYDYDGKKRAKSFGPGYLGKQRAEIHAATLEKQLTEGTYQQNVKKPWDEFVEEYSRRVLERLAIATKEESLSALAHFNRIMKPNRVNTLQTNHVDEYIAKR